MRKGLLIFSIVLLVLLVGVIGYSAYQFRDRHAGYQTDLSLYAPAASVRAGFAKVDLTPTGFETWEDVDAERIGIQGWSYGGYMASNCITQGADEFSMAIAVAPVTNWKYYDSIYTERFMRTPQENADGYDGCGLRKIHYYSKVECSVALIV